MPRIPLFALTALSVTAAALAPRGPQARPEYHIYAGNTHAHTANTWSHGDQWTPGPTTKMSVVDGVSHPGPNNVLRPDWEQHQGPPAAHFAAAKAHGYDFYVVTDHSQEATFQPVSAANPVWRAARQAAVDATTPTFVALAGYEHSENNGPGGMGHLNVINSAEYLNALAPGVDLPSFYRWLATVPADGEGPVVASFNHPGPAQYGGWAGRDAAVTGVLTMLEVINSNNKIHAEGFVHALDQGWKASPVDGNDNHGLGGITRQTSRTFVLATALTKAGILEAMQHRRTYASLDTNIQCRYSVNGAIMGSTLNRPDTFQFDIGISDPDQTNPTDRITKIDIVKDGGAVVQTWDGAPSASVHWTPTIRDTTSRYFFVRVWNAGGGDAPGADPAQPVAWLAPVWTGR
jgi:hypothetical protein